MLVKLSDPDVRLAAALQERWTAAWHGDVTAGGDATFAGLVEREHQANFALWHEEDRARDPGASDAEIARVKHAIDGWNQRRNDLIEEMDVWLLSAGGAQAAEAPLHSETPGMMLDRLSILALKLFHTRLEAERETATVEHRARSAERVGLLESQRADLLECLVDLLDEVAAGTRRFKLYRQLKMYNDPELNPRIYGSRAQDGEVGAGAGTSER